VDINEEANLPDREHQCPQQQRRPPVRYGQDEYADTATVQDFIHHVAYNECQVQEPNSLEETLQSEHARQWKAVADSEYNSLIKRLESLLNLLLTVK